MTDKGALMIISGPSGSGKGTVLKALFPNDKYALSVSVTTRQKRPGEIEGADYFFRTQDEFREMVKNDELLEHAMFVGNFYGTPRSYVIDKVNEGKIVFLEIEVNGALQVKDKYPEAVLVFLMPPTMRGLKNRLLKRNTEDLGTIEDRLQRASEEIKLIYKYDYLVINDDVHKAADKINTIVKAERMKPERSSYKINYFKGEI